jgi:prepilin-type processing-associated H-X9-DG protein
MPLAAFADFADALAAKSPAAGASPPFSVAAPPRTSGMAIASLVLGRLGVVTCGVTALVGLILGIIAMVKIRQSKGSLGGQGIALAGTIVSGIFLFLIPVYLAMMLPALSKAKERAFTTASMNNMKQLALAVRIYSGDNTNHLPPAATWCDAILPDVGGAQAAFLCPGADASKRSHYAYNSKLGGMEDAKINPGTVLLFECDGGWNASGGPDLVLRPSRHGKVFLVAFVDGHVEEVTESRLASLRWSP